MLGTALSPLAMTAMQLDDVLWSRKEMRSCGRNWTLLMKKYLPYVVGGLGLMLLLIGMVLRNGTPDADELITNLSSTFMMLAGAICFLVGVVTHFLRDDETVW